MKALIEEKNPDLENADEVAKDVGVGAVIFNDLKNRRETDIDFDLDQIVRFDGKTGPYVMYSHARACSILRKAGEALRRVDDVDVTLPERSRGVGAAAARRALPREGRHGAREGRAERDREVPARPLRGVPRLPHEGRARHRSSACSTRTRRCGRRAFA